MRGRTPIIVILAAFMPAPAVARADVLVSRPAPSVTCGTSIRTGVWYRDFPTRGRRSVTIAIVSSSGRLLWRRTVTATGTWRYFRYAPRCGRHYRVRYETAAGTTTFRVSVRQALEGCWSGRRCRYAAAAPGDVAAAAAGAEASSTASASGGFAPSLAHGSSNSTRHSALLVLHERQPRAERAAAAALEAGDRLLGPAGRDQLPGDGRRQLLAGLGLPDDEAAARDPRATSTSSPCGSP